MRYLVFAFDDYYPAGGWSDLKGQHHNSIDAIAQARDLAKRWQNVEIIDLETGEDIPFGEAP